MKPRERVIYLKGIFIVLAVFITIEVVLLWFRNLHLSIPPTVHPMDMNIKLKNISQLRNILIKGSLKHELPIKDIAKYPEKTYNIPPTIHMVWVWSELRNILIKGSLKHELPIKDIAKYPEKTYNIPPTIHMVWVWSEIPQKYIQNLLLMYEMNPHFSFYSWLDQNSLQNATLISFINRERYGKYNIEEKIQLAEKVTKNLQGQQQVFTQSSAGGIANTIVSLEIAKILSKYPNPFSDGQIHHYRKWEFSECVSPCTDGAPSMIGCHNGLFAKLRELNPNIIAVHYIIYQENLSAKLINMDHVNSVVVKTVNYINSRGLNHREFQEFLRHLESQSEDVIYFIEVFYWKYVVPGCIVRNYVNVVTESHHSSDDSSMLLLTKSTEKQKYLITFLIPTPTNKDMPAVEGEEDGDEGLKSEKSSSSSLSSVSLLDQLIICSIRSAGTIHKEDKLFKKM
ncbi:unnamed protein product [Lepeophtheirus salmonis]|uniref:(salmon louse) hypothetical protein n=1 Tax=Lepeophtheirus salmonis TaxID=72036 RepID=A0A7R8CJ68_LEPSM|nr:unnamed protein product [Lepeophtheirus salmonis]CAF2839479.1 unnamed protein product [Lepeophtheirus salmonis]